MKAVHHSLTHILLLTHYFLQCQNVVTSVPKITKTRLVIQNADQEEPKIRLARHYRTWNTDTNYIRPLKNNDITEKYQVKLQPTEPWLQELQCYIMD